MYLVLALWAGGTGAGQNIYLRLIFPPCPSFATEILFGNYHPYFSTMRRTSLPERKIEYYRKILLFTSRYLATGKGFHSFHQEHLFGVNHSRYYTGHIRSNMGMSTRSVCHRKARTGYVHQFYKNFHNCLDAVNDKHIRMCKPDDSGSPFFNHKSFFSTVLTV
jgi:hypothetical protein